MAGQFALPANLGKSQHSLPCLLSEVSTLHIDKIVLLLPTDLDGAYGIRCNFQLHCSVFIDKIIGGFRG